MIKCKCKSLCINDYLYNGQITSTEQLNASLFGVESCIYYWIDKAKVNLRIVPKHFPFTGDYLWKIYLKSPMQKIRHRLFQGHQVLYFWCSFFFHTFSFISNFCFSSLSLQINDTASDPGWDVTFKF